VKTPATQYDDYMTRLEAEQAQRVKAGLVLVAMQNLPDYMVPVYAGLFKAYYPNG